MTPGDDPGACPHGCDATIDFVLRQRDAARAMNRRLLAIAVALAALAGWGWLT